MNIISNAVKYNKEKGEILLSYYETQADDRHILFEFHCKDTGVGMSKEFQITRSVIQNKADFRTIFLNHLLRKQAVQDLFMEEQVLVCQLQKN